MALINELFPRLKKRISKEDVLKPMKLTISTVQGKIVFFTETRKALYMNGSMAEQISKITASDNTDEWSGKQITVFWDNTIMFGKKKLGGIRVKV